MSVAISAKNLVFSYPNAKKNAVDDFSVEIQRGSYTAIAGVNGSGKSTVAKIIAGILKQNSGTVEIHNNLRTGIVFQSPKDQIICGIVRRDTEFGPQTRGFSKSETELMTIESLKATGMLYEANKKSMFLSLGQTQKVALSGILAINPDILILDEALSMLDPVSKEEILNLLEILNKKGITILHISHDFDAIMRAQNIIAMKNGKLLWQGSIDTLNSPENTEILSYIKGPSLPKRSHLETTTPDLQKTALFAQNIDFSYGKTQVLYDISLDFEQGKLIAITGPSGSGKTTLLEILAGLRSSSNGKIFAEDRPVLCQQNSDSALFEVFAADDVAFGAKNRGIKGAALKKIVRDSMEKVNLPFDEFASRQTFCLSGGEKRRLSVAGMIALDAKILMFDEPTAGLDGETRFKVMSLLKTLAEEGKTVIFTTHRLDEAAFSDKNIIIEKGQCISANKERLEAIAQKNTLSEMLPLEGAKLIANFEKVSENQASQDLKKTKFAFFQKFPPVLKYIFFLTLFCTGLVARPIWLSSIFLAVSVFYAIFSAYPVKKLLLSMLKLVPLLLFFCIFKMIFAPALLDDTVLLPYKYFFVTNSKLLQCLKVLLHSEFALCSICAFVSSSTEVDIICGFEQLLFPLKLLHVPIKNAVVLVEIIFRFIPILIDEAISILKTQLVRGALKDAKGFFAKVRSIVPLIVPLIIQTIKRAEILADALTARGF